MTYIVKWTDGRTSEHTLKQLREDFPAGKFSSFCTVREQGSNEYSSIADLLKRTSSWPADEEVAPTTAGSGVASDVSQRASTRYRDAYLVARATDSIGGIVKSLGIILGVAVAVAGAVIGPNGPASTAFTVGGILLGIVIGIPLYALGVLVSAQGQVLKASLDDAVHTSPFLSSSQKASTMSLQ